MASVMKLLLAGAGVAGTMLAYGYVDLMSVEGKLVACTMNPLEVRMAMNIALLTVMWLVRPSRPFPVLLLGGLTTLVFKYRPDVDMMLFLVGACVLWFQRMGLLWGPTSRSGGRGGGRGGWGGGADDDVFVDMSDAERQIRQILFDGGHHSKLGKVDGWLIKYKGREEELLLIVEHKYGPPPEPQQQQQEGGNEGWQGQQGEGEGEGEGEVLTQLQVEEEQHTQQPGGWDAQREQLMRRRQLLSQHQQQQQQRQQQRQQQQQQQQQGGGEGASGGKKKSLALLQANAQAQAEQERRVQESIDRIKSRQGR